MSTDAYINNSKIGVLEEKITLYSNAEGNTGSVTLSQTALNFKYLLIEYYNYNNYYNTQMIPVKSGALFSLGNSSPVAGGFYYRHAGYTINGSTLTKNAQMFFNFGTYQGYGDEANAVHITAVIGIK